MCSWFVHLHPVIIWPIRHAALPPQKDGDQAARKQSLPCTSFAQAGCKQRAARSCPARRGRRGLVGVNGPHEALRQARPPPSANSLAPIPFAIAFAFRSPFCWPFCLPRAPRRSSRGQGVAVAPSKPERPAALARRRRTEAVNATGPCWLAPDVGRVSPGRSALLPQPPAALGGDLRCAPSSLAPPRRWAAAVAGLGGRAELGDARRTGAERSGAPSAGAGDPGRGAGRRFSRCAGALPGAA